MNITLITPAGHLAKNGNRTTALRWAKILTMLDHQVQVETAWDGRPADLMVAIHAWRSAESARLFQKEFPDSPLIILLSGTDIYKFQHTHPKVTLYSMKIANALACLHDEVYNSIPSQYRHKLHTIHQSALPLAGARRPSKRNFDICVVGNLREEKDPLRAAYAVRNLNNTSRLRVIHLGKAHTPDWAARATTEMARNNRYRWRGEVKAWEVRREFAKTRLMVLSSIMEGGANVISEAIAAGVPIIASKIEGSVGLLGSDYAGYFEAGSTEDLRRTLIRVENDPDFLAHLSYQCKARRHLFTIEREKEDWSSLLRAIGLENKFL